MSVDSSFTQEDKGLEMAEHLVRELISSEAERVAALGCTKHLQHLLCKAASREQSVSGASIKDPPKQNNKAQPAQPFSEADKENAHPMQYAGVSPSMPKTFAKTSIASPNKACVIVEEVPSIHAQRAELELQAHLSAMAHSTGRLRAQCAHRKEQLVQLQASLVDARKLLIHQTAETTSLQRRSIEFMDELRHRDASLSERMQMETNEAPIAVQQAQSELQQRNSELSQLCRTIDMVQKHRVMEIRIFQKEVQERAQEQSSLKCASEQAHSELHCLREMVKREEEMIWKMHSLEEKNFAQLSEIGVGRSQSTEVQLEEHCCAWKHEVQAQRSGFQKIQTEHAAAKALNIANEVREEEAVAEKMIHLQSQTDAVACELADMHAAMFSQQEHVQGEQQLCMRLASRLTSKDRAVKRLRQHKRQVKDQQQVLMKIEQQLKTLQNTLAKGTKCTKKVSNRRAPNVSGALQPAPQCDLIGVPLDVCREEAARILGSAAPRLGVASDGHAGDRAGGSDLPSKANLPCLAAATREAVHVIHAELVRLLQSFHAALPHEAMTSAVNHDRLTVRALLCELREIIRMSSLNVHDQSIDTYGLERGDAESPSVGIARSITDKLGLEMLKLVTTEARPSHLEESKALAAEAGLQVDDHKSNGVSAEMVPPTTLARSSGAGQAMSQLASPTCVAFCAIPCTISYPESLAGSPSCQRGVPGVADLLEAASPAKWEPDQEMCIEEFLEGCGKPHTEPAEKVQKLAPQPAEQIWTYTPGSPVAPAPGLPAAESPSSCVRRARGRLRELRLGLARPLGSCVQAEVCSPTQLPRRSASLPLLMR